MQALEMCKNFGCWCLITFQRVVNFDCQAVKVACTVTGTGMLEATQIYLTYVLVLFLIIYF